MHFSDECIELARKLRDAGLNWQPAVGHYVYDEAGLIEAPSPFRARIYFILDLKHFLRRSETIERLAEAMFWLPDWDQTRALLRERGVSDAEQGNALSCSDVWESGSELTILYQLLLNRIA